jgi:hypothetical protein
MTSISTTELFSPYCATQLAKKKTRSNCLETEIWHFISGAQEWHKNNRGKKGKCTSHFPHHLQSVASSQGYFKQD